jgi:hypothetical protein
MGAHYAEHAPGQQDLRFTPVWRRSRPGAVRGTANGSKVFRAMPTIRAASTDTAAGWAISATPKVIFAMGARLTRRHPAATAVIDSPRLQDGVLRLPSYYSPCSGALGVAALA